MIAQTHDHLITNKLYLKAQSAYREFHSIETALLRVKNHILHNINQQRVTLLVLLDLSAAQSPLQGLGITGNVYTRFESYLYNRFQSPSIAEHRTNSMQKTVYLRVPVLAHYCSSFAQANCSRSSSVIYPMCTPTLTIRICIYPSVLILELSSRPLYRLCKTESSTAPTSKVKNLGCWFDGQLKMDIQINSICKTAFFTYTTLEG